MVNNIILFDGECNFCDQSVHFIILRDKKARYHFAALQSDVGKELASKCHVPSNLNSIILLENNKCYNKSSAVLRICKNLKGAWKLFFCLIILPTPIRDYFYDIFARNRYKWFGKKNSCMLPSPEIRKRFL